MKVMHLIGAATLFAVSTTAFSQGLPPGATVPGLPGGNLNIVVDEKGFANGTDLSTLTVNGVPATIAVAAGQDGVPEYSTGGIFVAAGDIDYTNTNPLLQPPVSDVIRIYPSNLTGQAPAGDTFSVFSFTLLENINGVPIETTPDSRFDVTKIPNPNLLPTGGPLPIASLPEFPVVPYLAPNANSYTFISDNGSESPEPSSLVLCGVGGIGLLGYSLRRRRVA